MKKEINYLMFYFSTVLIATIIAFTVESRSGGVKPTVVVEAVLDKPNVDWTNIDNPRKKAYLEHLYSQSK
jgi:hypothetical protein